MTHLTNKTLNIIIFVIALEIHHDPRKRMVTLAPWGLAIPSKVYPNGLCRITFPYVSVLMSEIESLWVYLPTHFSKIFNYWHWFHSWLVGLDASDHLVVFTADYTKDGECSTSGLSHVFSVISHGMKRVCLSTSSAFCIFLLISVERDGHQSKTDSLLLSRL